MIEVKGLSMNDKRLEKDDTQVLRISYIFMYYRATRTFLDMETGPSHILGLGQLFSKL